MTYTPGGLRSILCNYQRRAVGARQRPPEDRLGTQAPPLGEAPWAASSRVWSDVEEAMRALPYNWGHITFTYLCLGGNDKERTSWRNGMSQFNWREKVGDFWCMSAGGVNRIVNDSLKEMAATLNGTNSANSVSLPMLGRLADGKSETVIETDPQLLPDLIDAH